MLTSWDLELGTHVNWPLHNKTCVAQENNDEACINKSITLFKSITMLCGNDIIIQNILHIQTECGEYSTKECQSHINIVMELNNVMSWISKLDINVC
jgi:hypothetical protein